MKKSAEILKWLIKLIMVFYLQIKWRAIDYQGSRNSHMKFGAIWGKWVQAFHESFIEEDEVN